MKINKKVVALSLGLILSGVLLIILTPLQFLFLNLILTTQLEVNGDTLYMNGTINSKTPNQIKEIFEENPDIEMIVMEDVPGSIDDDANLEIATWISKQDIHIHLNSDSEIASGGTDFFLAGSKRTIDDGAMIGVHSWSDGDREASELSKDDSAHQPYIDYYIDVGFTSEDADNFNFFTI